MDQHTYSFPKVSPADPHELRETLRALRRAASEESARRHGDDEPRRGPRGTSRDR